MQWHSQDFLLGRVCENCIKTIHSELDLAYSQEGQESGNNSVFSVREINLQSIKVKT